MKRWIINNKSKFTAGKYEHSTILKVLLENRGLTNKKDIEEFLDPKLELITADNVGIDKKNLKKALIRIERAIKAGEEIIVFGDYDVDGITGTAILWESLYALKAKVLPYIPDRVDEGYGLSVAGIKNLLTKSGEIKLIITVDNGIVANQAVDFANANGIDVIVTDHHTVGQELPEAYAVVHTTKVCGAGIAYLLSQRIMNQGSRIKNYEDDVHLELAALGTVADMVPLMGTNRAIVKIGIEKLIQTKRPGLVELFRHAGLVQGILGAYEIGFMIAPRLNAAGRIGSAMDSLRLLCTKDAKKARKLAEKLELTNRERQDLMKAAADDSITRIKNQESRIKKILIVSHEEYNQGIIGLVAGKLVEKFYRPSIVIAQGDKLSKASARSISGFNIIEFLRSKSEYLVNVGGHPMAAGFTIETEKIILFKELLESAAEELLDSDMLTKTLRIDCELPIAGATAELYKELQRLRPFGLGNPEPVFATKGLLVQDIRVIGKEGKHLKLKVKTQNPSASSGQASKIKIADQGSITEFEAIAFNMGELASEIKVGDKIDAAYTINENVWNGSSKIQLKLKDIKIKL